MEDARWPGALRKRALGLAGGKDADDSDTECVGDVERSRIMADECLCQRNSGSGRGSRAVSQMIDEQAWCLRVKVSHLRELARGPDPQNSVATLMQRCGKAKPLGQRNSAKAASGKWMESDELRRGAPRDLVTHHLERAELEPIMQLACADSESGEQAPLFLYNWFSYVFSRKDRSETR